MPRPTTITAELKQWRLDEKHRCATGVIENSKDRDFRDGDTWTFIDIKRITKMPAFITDTVDSEEYYLILTSANRYFKLYKSRMTRMK